jgi:hypothetical protein
VTGAPFAPWVLEGESIIGLIRWRGKRLPPPMGLESMPGPWLVTASAYASSPVGPFLELAVAHPARLGLRPGWCFCTVIVDNHTARLGARLNWGLPHELGALTWNIHGDERELVWVDRGITVRGRRSGPPVPWLLPMRAFQHRGDGPMVVPSRSRGLGHLSRVWLETPDDDLLAPLAGPHRGVMVGSLRTRIREARQPVGLTATLRAPLRAPEPAMRGTSPVSLPSR